MMAKGVAAIDLNQSSLRYFDWHHTPEDTLDRVDPEQLRQNVAAWTTMLAVIANAPEEIGAVDRKSVVEGKSVSVRVDLGGRRILKKKKKKSSKHKLNNEIDK